MLNLKGEIQDDKNSIKLAENGPGQVLGFQGCDMERICLKYDWVDNHLVRNWLHFNYFPLDDQLN